MQNCILDAGQIHKKIIRMAYEIYEDHADNKEIVIAGIYSGGYLLAQRIEQSLKKISPLKTTLLKIEADKKNPNIPLSIEGGKAINLSGKTIVLIDDVLNTGTILAYSMKVLLEHSVKSIKVAVLINRNHAVFPIQSNYTGLSIATTMQEHIEVNFKEKGNESVLLKD